jgi:hypothetical protein
MARSIAGLLTDFSPAASGENIGIGILRAVKLAAEPAPAPAPAPTQVDRQAELIRSLEAKVRAEEREAAGKRLDEALAAEKARHDQELNVQREIWAEQQGLQLSAQIEGSLVRMEADLSESVARILHPFVAQALREQALAELKEALATLLTGAGGKFIRIAGPEDMLSVIETELGSRATVIEFVPSDDVEVILAAQDTTVQTQLNSWLSRLEQALKAE